MPTTPTPDATAPELKLPLIIGTEWVPADQSPDAFTQMIVYRGLHCPACRQYLSQMRNLYDRIHEKGVRTIHVSMDTEQRARQAHENGASTRSRWPTG